MPKKLVFIFDAMKKSCLEANLKYLRKNRDNRITQADMAAMLGVSISTYGAYEEGRAEPKIDNLQKMADYFQLSISDLLFTDLSQSLPAGAESGDAGLSQRIITVTVDKEGKDNIEWVPVKAAAGYTRGLSDPGFIEKLPTFQLPFLNPARKYRAFTIEGDSMLPIPSGAMVFGEFVDDWYSLKDDTPCIVVTQQEGIVFKKVYNYLKSNQCLLLVSSNPIYKPYLAGATEILEIWKFSGYFSSKMPEAVSG